jgi:hypothetical protein
MVKEFVFCNLPFFVGPQDPTWAPIEMVKKLWHGLLLAVYTGGTYLTYVQNFKVQTSHDIYGKTTLPRWHDVGQT